MPPAKKARTVGKSKGKREDGVEEVPIAGPSTARIEAPEGEDLDDDVSSDEQDDDEELGGSDEDEDGDDDGASGDDEDDYDEIVQANEDAQTKPKKKRKRALPSQVFGSLLSSLISAPAPSKPLRPLHPPASEEALEKKALKLLQARKHEREERGHVPDVIGGWGPRPNLPFSQWPRLEGAAENVQAATEYTTGGAEKEKELRRLAQKGAVRLFNAIKAAQTTDKTGEATAPAPLTRKAVIKDEARRSVKEESPAASIASSAASKSQTGDRTKANLLGSRGKQEALANLSKASFLELFKSQGAAKPKLSA